MRCRVLQCVECVVVQTAAVHSCVAGVLQSVALHAAAVHFYMLWCGECVLQYVEDHSAAVLSGTQQCIAVC